MIGRAEQTLFDAQIGWPDVGRLVVVPERLMVFFFWGEIVIRDTDDHIPLLRSLIGEGALSAYLFLFDMNRLGFEASQCLLCKNEIAKNPSRCFVTSTKTYELFTHCSIPLAYFLFPYCSLSLPSLFLCFLRDATSLAVYK